MMRLTIDKTALTALAERVGATERQIDAARGKALHKTEKHIATEVRRQAAKELRMPQRALAGRLYRGDRSADTLRVWVGARPISPFRLGSPRAYGRPGKTGGVKVGRRDFPGAFLGAVYGIERVWIRLRSKHYSPELYPTIRRPGDRGYIDAGLRGRFPVVRAAVAIDAILAKVVERQQAVLVAAFTEEFGKQLRDQVAQGGGT